ncbi:MAG TPA: exodeoxyribonuclease I, partial [Crenotrichaceae bacterium]|nr:exodeoxyribonuclease I [Crenotrichaceae bacterium]
KQSNDYLPHPEACLVTGITPQIANQKGIREVEFIRAIQAVLKVPGTCIAGYNNIRYDDEITRHSLYRNLLDPYEHEWRHHNSRWDLLDVLRLMHALRPEGIVWPKDENGFPVFRLDKLTQANGIEHGHAHDALADVEATIALARLVRHAQPKLFSYCVQHRTKTSLFPLLNVTDMVPVLHVSGRYPASRSCIALVVPLAAHPANKNGIIVYDLSFDPEPLIELDASTIAEYLFTPRAEQASTAVPIALKTVHANKCPVVVPTSVLRREDAERLQIDNALCDKHLALLRAQQLLIQKKLVTVFSEMPQDLTKDPDFMLYSGGFLTDADKTLLHQLHTLSADELAKNTSVFEDQRLDEMLFRFRARNYPESLIDAERTRWDTFRLQRLQSPEAGRGLSLDHFHVILQDKKTQCADSPHELEILDDLEAYANNLATVH